MSNELLLRCPATQWKALQAYFAFVKTCFSVLISTAIVEACFSGFTSMKDRHRSMLGGGRVLDKLVSRQAVDVFANGAVSFRELELRLCGKMRTRTACHGDGRIIT